MPNFVAENLNSQIEMDLDNVAARLKKYIEFKNLTSSQFADLCGIPRPSLSQLLTGRNKKINDVTLSQIHSGCPDLSISWLLFGEGDMIPNGGSAKPTEPTAKEASETESSLFASYNSKSSVGSACQSPEIPTKDREKAKEPKEIGLKSSPNSHKTAVAQEIEHIQENAALLKQIEKMRANPRKVTQITIYYDDSTFETFYPGRK